MSGKERLCDECGSPISVCNARAMIREALRRGHKLDAILPEVTGASEEVRATLAQLEVPEC
jgi:hypothetical protein